MPADAAQACKQQLKERLKDCKKVFISKFKKESWEMSGDVILPGFDGEEWGGYNGIEERAITCLNNAMGRDFMNGTRKSALACLDYPHLILGEENGQGQLAQGFDAYKQILKESRVYVSLNNPEFEDGYNLSMLEFMACGGPAVTLEHPTSPVVNGVTGFKSNDLQEINKFIWTMTHEQAYNLGAAARQMVLKQFSMARFVELWNKVLEMP
jgi:glycosyltransferase involved in cell wall biosynthesis